MRDVLTCSDGHLDAMQSRVRRLRSLLLGAAFAAAVTFVPAIARAQSDDEAPPPPPPPVDEQGIDDGSAAPPDTEASEIAPLEPGEAVVTRFSHGAGQGLANVIDVNGISASIIDVRRPPDPPSGQHWIDETQRLPVTAGEVGQVFGVTLAPHEGSSPDIFLSATAAFGLHREAGGWMAGMWGPDAGPGTIYRISEDNGYLAEKFADVRLNGRPNTGAALGNIAHDSGNNRLYVSDLETGMIHSLDAETGRDLGHYDHGVDGRAAFSDAWTGTSRHLDGVAFDPSSTARTSDCSGDFSSTPECWNLADFRRRVWGLNVRRGESGDVRLYYSVWGSDALGNAEWAGAGDDRRNALWSVGLGQGGAFDLSSVRREFFLPAFWPATPAMGAKGGNSNPVSDITFPECGPQNVMIVAERGGMRNLGLDKVEAFARPYESRVLRYELGSDGIWRPKGRYDVGFHDRAIKDGEPLIHAGAAGGAAFGYGFGEDGAIDTSKSLWMTGDGLCSPAGACASLDTGAHEDSSEVHGLQGSPADASVPVDPQANTTAQTASSEAADFGALDDSYMIDTDINADEQGQPIAEELRRNDATAIGDVAIYQVCNAAPPLPVIDIPDEAGPPLVEPPIDWPVHTVRLSHDKWASTGHNTRRSWHQRSASWHSVDRSWHWRSSSWHLRSQTWHWRQGSWHSKERSWHRKGQSLHAKRFSWHFRDRSWHEKTRSYHLKNRTWGNGHVKGRSFHVRSRSWGNDHVKGRSFHVRNRTWDQQHLRGRSFHVKNKTWGDQPNHVKGRSFHVKGKTWGDQPNHVKARSFHVKGQTWGDDNRPNHVKGRSFHVKAKTWGDDNQPNHVKGRSFHVKAKTWGDDGQPNHVKGRSFHKKGSTWGDNGNPPAHNRKKSLIDQGGGNPPVHGKKQSRIDQGGGGNPPAHNKKKSRIDQGGGGNPPVHNKRQSRIDQGGGGNPPVHNKKKSRIDQGGGGGKPPVHNKKQSRIDKAGAANDGNAAGIKKRRVHVKGKSEFVLQ